MKPNTSLAQRGLLPAFLLVMMGNVLVPFKGYTQSADASDIEVQLSTGKVIQARFVAANPDTLLIKDYNQPVVGSRVTIACFRHEIRISGEVRKLTDSLVVVAFPEAPYEQAVYWSWIKELVVTRHPATLEINDLATTSIPVADLQAVWAMRGGNSGAILSEETRCAVESIVGSINNLAAMGAAGFFLGGTIGYLSPPLKKKFDIRGDAVKYRKFATRMTGEVH